MKYTKNQYTDGFSICALIIAGGFLYWGISSFFPYTALSWWGLIPLFIGLAILLGQIAAIFNRKKLKRAVKYEFEGNPNASIKEISKSTGISRKDVQAIILDLKGAGELRGKFSSKTGQLKAGQVQPEGDMTSPDKGKYCPSCGTQIKNDDAEYCEFCGAELK